MKQISTVVVDGKTYTDISNLYGWKDNPRKITKEGYERLKKQIGKHGEYKPLIITSEGEVLGGNMRLLAYKEMGKTQCWVSIVEANTDQKKLEFALSDNDKAGEYENERVIALLSKFPDFALDDYHIDSAGSLSLQNLLVPLSELPVLNEEYSPNVGKVTYEPKETNHKVGDLFEKDNRFDEEIEKISNPELKEFFKARVFNFYKFNFEKIADYYAYQATTEEQRIFEKLALVLLDRDQLIEKGFSKLVKDIELTPEEYETNLD